jgi:SAM-dependent methyltransferase
LSDLSSLLETAKVLAYVLGGRVPGSKGYRSYRQRFISAVLTDPEQVDRFRYNRNLPLRYGMRLDERAVEYPWLFSRLMLDPSMMLDAGGCLNHSYLLERPELVRKSILVYTLSAEGEPLVRRPGLSYVFGDLRRTLLRSDLFDLITCISTIEHVGMDNTRFYSSDARHVQVGYEAQREVIVELHRVLAPGGRLFLTLPYGRAQDLGWLRQFDAASVSDLVGAFPGRVTQETYFRYGPEGWQLADPDACSDCSYHDMHSVGAFDGQFTVAAQAVACLELVK